MAEAVPVVVTCEKGGVGKTWTAISIGRGSLMAGLPAVLVDCDPFRRASGDGGHDDLPFGTGAEEEAKFLAHFADVDPDHSLGLKRELSLRVEQSEIFTNRHVTENNYGILAQALAAVPNGVYDTPPNEALRLFETFAELRVWALPGFPMMRVAVPILNDATSVAEGVETVRAALRFREAAVADGAPADLVRRFRITVVYNRSEERRGARIGNFGNVLDGTAAGRELGVLLREQKALGAERWVSAISFPNDETPLTEALAAARIDRFRALRLHRRGELAQALPGVPEPTIRNYIGGLAEAMGHVAGELHRSGLVALPSDEVRALRDELGLREGADKLQAFLGAGGRRG